MATVRQREWPISPTSNGHCATTSDNHPMGNGTVMKLSLSLGSPWSFILLVAMAITKDGASRLLRGAAV